MGLLATELADAYDKHPDEKGLLELYSRSFFFLLGLVNIHTIESMDRLGIKKRPCTY